MKPFKITLITGVCLMTFPMAPEIYAQESAGISGHSRLLRKATVRCCRGDSITDMKWGPDGNRPLPEGYELTARYWLQQVSARRPKK